MAAGEKSERTFNRLNAATRQVSGEWAAQ